MKGVLYSEEALTWQVPCQLLSPPVWHRAVWVKQTCFTTHRLLHDAGSQHTIIMYDAGLSSGGVIQIQLLRREGREEAMWSNCVNLGSPWDTCT